MADVFGAGHLGELTKYVPFDLVDAVLAETGRLQKRLRLLPSRVGIYFLLALGLFPHLGYVRVWGMLTGAVPGAARVSEKALRDVRHRVGPEPVKLLFDPLAVPAADPRTPGLRYRRWRTVAFDGCASLRCPDSERNRAWLGRAATGRGGFHGYPCLQLMTLAETGTRALLGAVFGPSSTGEITYAARLVDRLDSDMLLADRVFDSGEFLAAVRTAGAQFLVRIRAGRSLPRLAVLPDGSILTRLGRLDVRVIQAQVTTHLADGTPLTGRYALATSLLDHRAHPAGELIELYHERWEIESGYLALRHTLLRGRVLRSMDPARTRTETVVPAHPLPDTAPRDGRRRPVATGPGSRPGRLHRCRRHCSGHRGPRHRNRRPARSRPAPGHHHRRPRPPAPRPPSPALGPQGQITDLALRRPPA
ncbi:transposase domain-containing protein [Streptomyces populi]